MKENNIICEYFDTFKAYCFSPKITLPTRFSNSHGTRIDNFLYKLSKGFFKSSAGILISSISYHFPYFICLGYNKPVNNVPKLKKIESYDTDCLNQFKTDLINSNTYDKLNKDKDANPNNNYNLLDEIITTAMDKFLPVKIIKYNKHKHKKSRWITQGIIRSIQFRDRLYSRIKLPYMHQNM